MWSLHTRDMACSHPLLPMEPIRLRRISHMDRRQENKKSGIFYSKLWWLQIRVWTKHRPGKSPSFWPIHHRRNHWGEGARVSPHAIFTTKLGATPETDFPVTLIYPDVLHVLSPLLFILRKHALNCHRMKPALFSVLCEIKEKTGK